MIRRALPALGVAGLVVGLVFAPASWRGVAAAGDLDSAKALYASASYEEALATLNGLDAGSSDGIDPIQVNQYRALCLLALGRAREAEAPLQQMVAANPLYTMPADEVSPKLIDLFKQVRRRVLPAAARDMYAKAKTSYDAKQPADAAAQFKRLLSLLNDPEIREATSEASDLKVLAEGFLALAQAQAAAATPPPAVPAPAAAAGASGAPAIAGGPTGSGATGNSVQSSEAPTRIYSTNDGDVKGPVERQRVLPQWHPVTPIEKQTTRRGVLQIVVNEQGQVETATLLTSISPSYDSDLVAAAKNWRYAPATRQGAPVKYMMTLEIVLRPTAATARE